MDDIAQQISEQIPHLRRYARVLARDRTRADDLVQDCLERAWSRLHLWQPGSNLKAWLFTILHNLHANQVRKLKRALDNVPLSESHLSASTPATQMQQLEVKGITDALQRLSEEQRAVVLLVGLEEMSYQEAAKVLDVPIGTVMSRLHRGRERVRQLLADQGQPVLRRVK